MQQKTLWDIPLQKTLLKALPVNSWQLTAKLAAKHRH